MRTAELETTVDLYKVVKKAWGIEEIAADRLVSDGQLTIDGNVVRAEWMRDHWTVRQLYGRMMRCPQRGSYRLFGSVVAA